VITFGMYFNTSQRIRINWHGVVCVCASVFSVISRLYCSPFVPDWWVVIVNVCTGYKMLKIIHVACGVIGFAMQGDFEFLGWLVESNMYWLYYRTRLEHMIDLMFSQPQIRNPVEYHFGLGLEF